MFLKSFACSFCQGAGLEVQSGGGVACRYCGTINTLDGVVCPECDYVNAAEADTCANCRRALRHACGACGTQNWAGAEACRQCGQPLDAMARLSTRWGLDPSNRLNQQQHAAAQIKLLELDDSRRRMAELDSIEDRRQADLRAGWERQAKRQRQVAWVLGASVLVFVLAVSVIVLMAYPR